MTQRASVPPLSANSRSDPKKPTGFQYCGPSGAPPTFKFVMITLWIDHLVDRKVSGRSVCSSEVAVRGPFKRQVGINFHASQ